MPFRLLPTAAALALLAAAPAWAQPTPPGRAASAPRPAASGASGAAPAIDLPAAAATGDALTASLKAGPRIGIDEITRTVIDNNPDLLSARRARNTAAAGISSAGAYPNPRVEYATGRQNARLPGTAEGRMQSFGLSQLIENPALRAARRQGAEQGERVASWEAARTRNELVAQVRLRSYDLLLRQAQAAAAAEAASLLAQVNARVRARVDSGEAPRYELIKADAETVTARSQRDSAVLQARQAAIELNRLAAGALPTEWSLDARLDENAEVLPDPAQLRTQMLDRNPELMSLGAEVERMRARLGEAEANRFPGVELRYNAGREPDVRNQTVGVSVSIPLFDRRTGPIAEAGSEYERARGRLEGRRAELEQQLQIAEQSLAMARLRVDALSQGAVRDAEAAVRVADAAWRFGERGILDVLDAQRVLRNVRADLLNARFEVQSARIELDLLAGRWADPLPLLPSAALDRAGLK